jgi:hypothetical protein
VALASLSERVSVTRVLLPLVVAVVASAGIALARHNPDQGAGIVAVAAVVALVCAVLGERGAAIAAIGVGAAASFPAPDGLGPLLAVTGVVITGDIGLVDRHLVRWRYLIDALVCLPALGGLAGTIAAQPSQRAVALGAASGLAIAVTLWRNRTVKRPRFAASPISYIAALAAIVVVLAPDRLTGLGDLPPATITAARSLAAGLAVFALVVVADVLWAERQAAR